MVRPSNQSEPKRLLIVCLGNICRSPMAEGALRTRLSEAGLGGQVQVDSVGTGDWHVGDPPDPRAIACAARNAVDISGLRARQLSRADFERFDRILCADASTLRNVLALAPQAARGRCALMSSEAGRGGADIPDPYTGDASHFDRVWTMVDAMARAIVDDLGAGRG